MMPKMWHGVPSAAVLFAWRSLKITPDAPKNERVLTPMIMMDKSIRHKWVNQLTGRGHPAPSVLSIADGSLPVSQLLVASDVLATLVTWSTWISVRRTQSLEPHPIQREQNSVSPLWDASDIHGPTSNKANLDFSLLNLYKHVII